MSEDSVASAGFAAVSSNPRILSAVSRLGFEQPTPIQAQAIPLLLQGRDVLGQAQTGTGKTAAFGLPLVEAVDPENRNTQALVLAPTRELALQVAQALEQFAAEMSNVRVVAIYGGQDYSKQFRAFKAGAHIVVGTPGRVMDHMRRGSLKLDGLQTLVLDEADEMLNMGFVESIEWILEQCPKERQTALFSATFPSRIRSIAQKHMQNPEQVRIQNKNSGAPSTICQRQWLVRGMSRVDALSRILEAEPRDAALIFVRTRLGTTELAEALGQRKFKAGALHGEMSQAARERTVTLLKGGQIDILVATDVAARGLDIDRFSHVINYDMPTDVETYLHRIGRTGRAGREGHAISFIVPRQMRLLKLIEQKTRQSVKPLNMPSYKQINGLRIAAFKVDLQQRVDKGELEPFLGIVSQLATETELDPLHIAAALAQKAQGRQPLLLDKDPAPAPRQTARPAGNRRPRDGKAEDGGRRQGRRDNLGSRRPRAERPLEKGRGPRREWAGDRAGAPPRSERKTDKRRSSGTNGSHEPGMARYRLGAGLNHGISPTHIVGAITNMSGLRGHHIGRITINSDHTLVDLPASLPPKTFHQLSQIRICRASLNRDAQS